MASGRWVIVCAIFAFCLAPGGAGAGELEMNPVTAECVVEAAHYHQVPLALLSAIMEVEGGTVGMKKPNPNGTHDYGPMQVNTVWLKKLRLYGVGEGVLRYDGCANIYVGAWILKQQLRNYPFWEAVGSYHSRTPFYNVRYQGRVYRALRQIRDLGDIVARANGFSRRAERGAR